MFDPIFMIRKLGHEMVERVWRLGFATRFFWALLMHSGSSFRRLSLTLREIYFSGVMSLLIIMVSGLFVGLVLGLQGYEILQRFGSTEALGTLVSLSLTRELGPVLAAIFFASRAGSSVTAEIGLMKATEQLKAMDMMAVNPIARVVAPRFWGGVISLPLLAALFSVYIFLATPAKKILMENGAVAGVLAKDSDGKDVTLGAKAVVKTQDVAAAVAATVAQKIQERKRSPR